MGQISTYMDYERVRRLADQVTQAASTLRGGRNALGQGPGVGASVPNPFGDDPFIALGTAFGNTDNARSCQAAYHQVQGAGDTATERLGAVLDSDVERLGQVITCFQQTDHDAADRICAAGSRGMDVLSAHVHSHGSGSADNDDLVRSGQIDRLGDAVDRPTVIGADLNAEASDGNKSAEEINEFEERGFDVHSGGVDEDGEVVGTSAAGKRVDYVVTSPTIRTTGPPQLVDGGPSDHDGQRADIVVPDW
ncbi:MAG: hypothetical protein GEV03_19860 [Streptosporangiales bacterium]|nr:hypothetical protein [Streptosporangiales bacterium]